MEDVVKSFLFVFATFLPIIDPFGGAMFFLSLTPGASDEIRAKITERMAIYSDWFESFRKHRQYRWKRTRLHSDDSAYMVLLPLQ